MENPNLRTLTVPEIIAGTFRLYKENLATLVILALIPHILMLLISLGITLPEKLEPGVIPKGILISGLLHALLYAFTLTALTVAITRMALGREQMVLGVFGAALKRPILRVMLVYMLTMFVLAFFITPGLASGSVFAIVVGLIPALWLGGFFSPVVPVIIIERRGIFASYFRAVLLLRGEFMKSVFIFSFFMAVSTVFPLLVMLMQIPYVESPLTPVLGALVGSLTLPLGYTAIVLLFLSLRGGQHATTEQIGDELDGKIPPPEIQGKA